MSHPQTTHRRAVRVAVVGVGNCASALVQGVAKYTNATPDEFVPGLMHVDLGGYHVRDIQFVAAFDVDSRKVSHDLSEAIFAEPNNTVRFADVPKLGVMVSRGRTLDDLDTVDSAGIDCRDIDWVRDLNAVDERFDGRGRSERTRATRDCA